MRGVRGEGLLEPPFSGRHVRMAANKRAIGLFPWREGRLRSNHLLGVSFQAVFKEIMNELNV